MIRAGFVGWRGMVGSVLMQRMIEEGDFDGLEATFYSTSQAGSRVPEFGATGPETVMDAMDLDALASNQVILSCQGGEYTSTIYPRLRESGWRGYWVDAASTLRMAEDAVIVLDPVNRNRLDHALEAGVRSFIGGNCTVSLMLMAIYGLFRESLVEWVSTMTYQAASGAGAAKMRELVAQMHTLAAAAGSGLTDESIAVLELDRAVQSAFKTPDFPLAEIGAPLAGSLIPWIDRAVEGGQTREEWKGFAETNKVLGLQESPIPVDGICVRVGSMRCHSQGLTIKLKRELPLDEIEEIIASGTAWTEVVPNNREETVKRLSPAAVSGTLQVPVGRVRPMRMGRDYLTLFTVGDQLLWGAAEPVRRMLAILAERLD
ncbi:MAG: aspartate-semialdehyde dehydrogenase [Spirochaetaceae bacterium]